MNADIHFSSAHPKLVWIIQIRQNRPLSSRGRLHELEVDCQGYIEKVPNFFVLPLHDHIIITEPNGYTSFAERGLL